MKFSFVLLTWNRRQFLEKCLEGLTRSLAVPGSCEIVVMDNGSTDGTREILERYAGSPLIRVIYRAKNYGLNAYKKLFAEAKGEYVVIVDDDVLEFPPKIDAIFADYMTAFQDYGMLALNVVQNEFTNGAKPGPEAYTLDTRDGRTVEEGQTGGWCACFRRQDYRKLRLRLMFTSLSMRRGEDGFLVENLKKRLGLRAGIIQEAVCFHASGPYYARQYGHLDREIEKYAQSGLTSFVEDYRKYADKNGPKG